MSPDQQITSFDDLTNAEKMLAVHAAYGRAMLYAHGLEKRLSALLIANTVDQKKSREDTKEEIASIDRLTLGSLIKRVASEYELSDDLLEELDNMLSFRNELAHRISNQLLAATREQAWEEKTVVELGEIATYFRRTSAALSPFVSEWFSNNGFDQAEILRRALTQYPGIAKLQD